MARRYSGRRESRMVLETRAPRKGTVVIAAIFYVSGLFGYLGWLNLNRDLSVGLLAVAGLLLLLGALLRDL